MTDLDPTTVQPTPVPSVTAPDVSGEPPASPYEATLDAAPAAPVHGPDSTLRRRPVRWPVAIVLIAIVLAVSAFVGILVTGQAPNARVLGYVPDGTIAYGEARLDLPGDQRLAVASFLSKFPGFADQSALETKLNEVLDRFVGGVTNGDQAYTTDIQPWFDGELAFAVGPLPDPATLSSGDPAAMNKVRYLVLVSIKDEAGVTAWFKGVATSSGASLADEAYNGATLTMLTGERGVEGAFAVLGGKVAVLGDVESVKAAVDTKGASPFATQPNPKAALDATDSSHVGFIYLDTGTLLDWSERVSQSALPSGGSSLTTGALSGFVPSWAAFAIRVEGDAVVLESVSPRTAAIAPATQNRTSTVPNHIPATAVVAVVVNDYGAGIMSSLNAYRADPSMKPVIDQIDSAAGMLGGLDAALGWIGDTGIVVDNEPGGVEAGVIIQPTDRAAADRILTSLRTLVALGGSQSGITVKDEAYAGATITTIDLGDVGTLLESSGLSSGMLGPGVTLPTGRVELAYAVTDQVVVFGTGPAFVKHVLDTTSGSSLASNDRYKALVSRVGSGTGTAFVDIAAIRAMAEGALATLDPSAAAHYKEDVAPYLAPFDALMSSGSVGNDLSSGKLIITVK
jgi:hypothetical protein